MVSLFGRTLENLRNAGPAFRDAVASRNVDVLRSLLGPAWRGFVQQQAKQAPDTALATGYEVHFDWTYERAAPDFRRLYEVAKKSQWNATTDLDWSNDIDPGPAGQWLIPDDFIPMRDLKEWRTFDDRKKEELRHATLSWLLSQFLHGEQGALYAAAQVTEAVPWLDAKLYGSTQVVDEGRHVEVFHTYLTDKLGKLYPINDNLYVLIDALIVDESWDMKFLGMQIMIEGLALGAFGTIRQATKEPLLRELLKYVITDEARHVHYGVLALERHYREADYSDRERRYREDWTFEVTLQLRNRFLAHELREEYFAHRYTRKQWDELIGRSELMQLFRKTMFKRIIPNLRRLGLLTDRVKPRYAALGLLDFEKGRAAPDLTARDLIDDVA